MSHQSTEKRPCSKCGEMTYLLCYIGQRLACVDCFGKACQAAQKRADAKAAQPQGDI